MLKEMIVDIDDSETVQSFVDRVTEGWFKPEEVYSTLKASGKTNSTDFWVPWKDFLDNPTGMLADVAESINQSPEKFLNVWNKKCVAHEAKIMGYHCTRHSNQKVFAEKGILPLSNETIRTDEEQSEEAKSMWERRVKHGPGPYFMLSYRWAKNPEHSFCSGPEILMAVTGCQVNADKTKLVPLIIHCAIPYSILPDKDYYAFCILLSYFNLLDPGDDSTNLFEGYSIDLKGNALHSKYIVRLEIIKTI